MSENTTRRAFIKTGAVTAAGVMTAASASKVHGANERIRLGFRRRRQPWGTTLSRGA